MRLHPAVGAIWLLAAAPAWPQSYEISWSTVDGGGSMNGAGGPYVLGSTSGQPDAGGPFSGGAYALHSGFWALIAGGPAPQADLGVTKTDGAASATPGQVVTYAIVASNAGPSPVVNATVADAPPVILTGVTWTCTPSPGSSCPASGVGVMNASVNLLSGGTATFSLSGTLSPSATGLLVNTASITPPAGVSDPNSLNNSAADSDLLTPVADLLLTKTDSPDPVAQGGSLTYTIQVTNLGPSAAAGITVTDVLSGQVTFVSSTPGPPVCTHASGTITCNLAGPLLPAAVATLTAQVLVSPSALGTITNTATATGTVPDPVPGNNTESEPTQVILRAEGELGHGTRLLGDLAGVGSSADQDLFRIRQEPYASYEIVLDASSGDVGIGQGPALDRVAADGSTILQSSQPVGVGHGRQLRFANATATPAAGDFVRVRSNSCGSDCGADDVYRLRAWETTVSIPRFNNSGTQVTVLILQNRGVEPVGGAILFWSAGGTLLHQQPLSLASRGSVTILTSAIGVLTGQSGSITVLHDGGFGALAGKAVALEPAAGYSFDSVAQSRPR